VTGGPFSLPFMVNLTTDRNVSGIAAQLSGFPSNLSVEFASVNDTVFSVDDVPSTGTHVSYQVSIQAPSIFDFMEPGAQGRHLLQLTIYGTSQDPGRFTRVASPVQVALYELMPLRSPIGSVAYADVDEVAPLNASQRGLEDAHIVAVEPVGVLAGEVKAVSLIVQGTLSDSDAILLWADRRSGYLEIPMKAG